MCVAIIERSLSNGEVMTGRVLSLAQSRLCRRFRCHSDSTWVCAAPVRCAATVAGSRATTTCRCPCPSSTSSCCCCLRRRHQAPRSKNCGCPSPNCCCSTRYKWRQKQQQHQQQLSRHERLCGLYTRQVYRRRYESRRSSKPKLH